MQCSKPSLLAIGGRHTDQGYMTIFCGFLVRASWLSPIGQPVYIFILLVCCFMAPALPGHPVTIHLGSSVVGYRPDTPYIILSDGAVIRGDIVVGADGIHTLAAEAVFGRKVHPQPPAHYKCCYRFLIPASTLESDPKTKFWNVDSDGEKTSLRIITHNATNKRLVSYPCREHSIHSFVGLFYDNSMKLACREDYLATVDKSMILERFADFHPSLLEVISEAADIKRWPLLYRAPVLHGERAG
ncbi:hypothetical protein QBC46DRAFT_73997 [Diplogelasinospora grovesii]|uniref:FAD-binding domain-containing protein n=1 Tax=Diplogelasinospora grovesii TaxID=303347 RepID=A0AAN6RZ51_9PEZI|nr:hypothetical protein QBC46DRAFT_73997 [Diplogelasinospora grovesii]